MTWGREPVSAFAKRHRLSAATAERIARLHPDGIEIGCWVRGVFRKPMSWRRAKAKIARGEAVYRDHRIPGGAIYRWWQNGGRPFDQRRGA